MSHSFYDWKLCELFLLSGFLICHAVGWYIELKNQRFWWRIPEKKSWFKVIQKIFRVFSKSKCDLCHYASKQFHNISVVPLLLQTEAQESIGYDGIVHFIRRSTWMSRCYAHRHSHEYSCGKNDNANMYLVNIYRAYYIYTNIINNSAYFFVLYYIIV